jgi:uncharacterized oxidoreductase
MGFAFFSPTSDGQGEAMNLSNRTALVTGGTGGIGLGIAGAFHRAGSKVIVCGRDPGKISKVEAQFPGITALACDVGDADERRALAVEVLHRFPDLDVLVNNAGIQRYINLKAGYEELKAGQDEIAVNLVATIELTALFIAQLVKRPAAAIINVSSGLAFMPMVAAPIYCATKAAVHTYSLVLRQQLQGTSVRVIEIVPPMVDTALNKEGRDSARLKFRGLAVSDYIPGVVKGLESDADVIFHGDAGKIVYEPRGESEGRLLK